MEGHPLDRSMEPYYERRSAEYDDWYLGSGLFAERDRPGWDEDATDQLRLFARRLGDHAAADQFDQFDDLAPL